MIIGVVPREFKVLIGLRILGRGNVADDMILQKRLVFLAVQRYSSELV